MSKNSHVFQWFDRIAGRVHVVPLIESCHEIWNVSSLALRFVNRIYLCSTSLFFVKLFLLAKRMLIGAMVVVTVCER